MPSDPRTDREVSWTETIEALLDTRARNEPTLTVTLKNGTSHTGQVESIGAFLILRAPRNVRDAQGRAYIRQIITNIWVDDISTLTEED